MNVENILYFSISPPSMMIIPSNGALFLSVQQTLTAAVTALKLVLLKTVNLCSGRCISIATN